MFNTPPPAPKKKKQQRYLSAGSFKSFYSGLLGFLVFVLFCFWSKSDVEARQAFEYEEAIQNVQK